MLQTINVSPKKSVKTASGQFRADVVSGLRAEPKHLQSKYFYDAQGDALFQQIMAMPEYYLTRCELDVFKNRTTELAALLTAAGDAFDLIELGAGDATKSSFLLKHLVNQNTEFTYMPIDISGNILGVLDRRLKKEIPGLDIHCLEGEYFQMLQKAAHVSDRRKVVMFLGGNIGNMEKEEALAFCRELRSYLTKGDIVLIVFDLKKNLQTILDAYNDPKGITAAFKLNLLTRMNRELGADFIKNNFEHYQNYDPISGACRSYLVSLKEQEVTIGDTSVHFDEDETIYMEVSQKFSVEDIHTMAYASGFSIAGTVNDNKNWFTDSIWVAE
jgi:dimethylhistidine N-methyltransferase